MAEDEIVEETRLARAKLLEQAGGDLQRLFELLRQAESKEPLPPVSLPPRQAASDKGRAA